MLFSQLYKIMVNEVTFVGFRGGDRPNRPPWIRPCVVTHEKVMERGYLFQRVGCDVFRVPHYINGHNVQKFTNTTYVSYKINSSQSSFTSCKSFAVNIDPSNPMLLFCSTFQEQWFFVKILTFFVRGNRPLLVHLLALW